MLAIKTPILKAMAADPQWSTRLEAANTTQQVFTVVEAYCREKGLQITHVTMKG